MSAEPESKKQGDCYSAAYGCMQVFATARAGGEPALAGAKIFLVHGSVITRADSLFGKRIDHAWIEIERPGKCVVFEFANNKQGAKQKGEWVREIQAIEEKRYTPEEAGNETGGVSPPHYGPWHREPREAVVEAEAEAQAGAGRMANDARLGNGRGAAEKGVEAI